MAGGFGNAQNGEVFRFGVFSDTLYATTWSVTSTHGAEKWRSSTGNQGEWTQAEANGFGKPSNAAIPTLKTLNGYLYASTYNWNYITKPPPAARCGEPWMA